MADLRTKIGPLELKNPVTVASGTYGYGTEYKDLCPPGKLGAAFLKGITINPRGGNLTPRIVETPCGMLNAIGLQNVGLDRLIHEKLPALDNIDGVFIANISGETVEEFVEIAAALDSAPNLAALEVNVSCPNVKAGGMSFGVSSEAVREITRKVREATSLPIIVKLSPNVTDITHIAIAAEEGGADAISLINTLLGMVIDIDKRRPVLGNVTGGLSGPAIRPVAVRMVWHVFNVVNIPVIGMGGIFNTRDALEFFLAGASAISIGTGLFHDPSLPLKIIDELNEYLDENGIRNISEITGKLEV